jgi:hypothetical protein
LIVAAFPIRLDCRLAVGIGWGRITMTDVSLFIARSNPSDSDPEPWRAT